MTAAAPPLRTTPVYFLLGLSGHLLLQPQQEGEGEGRREKEEEEEEEAFQSISSAPPAP
jgi:hypothetical protein